MATRTQVHLEASPGCVHEQICQSVYQRQWPRIQSLCHWMSASPAEARELAQSVFVETWRGAEAPLGDSSRLEQDRFAEVLAARFRPLYHNGGASIPARPRLLAPAYAPVRAALAALPSPLRLLYLLHDGEGYPAARVADWVGLEPGACARLIHEARLRMRASLRAA